MVRLHSFAIPLLCALFAAPLYVLAQNATAPEDAAIQADVQKALHKKQFKDVQVAVANGIVTLTGNVEVYNDKRDADHKAQRGKVVSVVDQLQVVPPPDITDDMLRQKLGKGLSYDRIGFGTTVYNSFRLLVDHGVATVSGVVYGPPDKDSALDLIGNTPGVVNIVDNIQVAPVSPVDDRIRRAEFAAIYGYPSLHQYAIDPAKTIRIIVVNGNVTLSGVVDSEADKDLVYLRGNSVSGVFSVKNDLYVQGAQPGK